VWRIEIERKASSPVTGVDLMTYANLSPLPPNSIVPELPVADWAMDGRNDFAAVWDEVEETIVHFHPNDQRVYDKIAALVSEPAADYGPIGAALAQGTPSAEDVRLVAQDLDQDYSPGTYLALTTEPPPEQHQIGFDATDFCAMADELIDNLDSHREELKGFEVPMDPAVSEQLRCKAGHQPVHSAMAWKHTAQDAWADAADGSLSGSSIAAGEVNEALRTPLIFVDDGGRDVAVAAVVLGAAQDAETARRAASYGVGDPLGVVQHAEHVLEDWLAERTLPPSGSPLALKVARRSLVNVRVGTDQKTGAIVASITRQPPYGLDWPRDGAFFNVALDVSGQTELAEKRAALYAQWQRKNPVPPAPLVDQPPPPDPDTGSTATYPAFAWEMNYYADGSPGGMYRFEIDNAGFVVWLMVAHVGWTRLAPKDYLEPLWTEIEAAADLLARWRDPKTGLHAPAQEDDNATYTQTLHGAVTTFGALDIAARAARLLARDDKAEAWETRATELRDAILEHLYDPDAGRFVSKPVSEINLGSGPKGPTAWLIWPTHTMPWEDPRVQRQIELDVESIQPVLDLKAEGGSYYTKTTVSAALAWKDQPDRRPTLIQIVDKVAGHATPDTQQYGEVMLVVDDGGAPRADQRTSTPHLWEGTLFYLTAMAVADPASLLRYDEVLPASRVPPPSEAPPLPNPGPDAGGPGDTGTGGPDAAGAADVAAPATDSTPVEEGSSEGCGCRVGATSAGTSEATGALGFLLAALAWRRRRSSNSC